METSLSALPDPRSVRFIFTELMMDALGEEAMRENARMVDCRYIAFFGPATGGRGGIVCGDSLQDLSQSARASGLTGIELLGGGALDLEAGGMEEALISMDGQRRSSGEPLLEALRAIGFRKAS